MRRGGEVPCAVMHGSGEAVTRRELSNREKGLLVSALTAVWRHMESTAELRRRASICRQKMEVAMKQAMVEPATSGVLWDAPFLMANTIIVGVLPRESPRWWIRRRTGGMWGDLCISDDATSEYFHEKLRMSKDLFYGIIAACNPYLQRQLTHYYVPLQPDHVVAYALYKWASGETFDSGTSSFGIGRATDITIVRDDARVLWNSSLFKRAVAGTLFDVEPIVLPRGVSTKGYLLGDNGSDPKTWMVFPYRGVEQQSDVAIFDGKQKAARGVVERAFGRLKGMRRLFLRHHKTNMENMPQQFPAVCIFHNLLIEARIDFDERVLLERDADGTEQMVDLGMYPPAAPVRQRRGDPATLALRDALRARMAILPH
ncbi:hypothetical protein CBR_g41629 [Chara braunii]|uniref:Uncharacterized protein n=1 Tax=Chara braunii TaxID=69332 RepID=A0A388LW62_CHABU|nr:hypothetical protein CBR_g41629 [Chara braunii]|eukprot:GBG86567.1 hypothetical protein CBR_g41629 [Chara braunii]